MKVLKEQCAQSVEDTLIQLMEYMNQLYSLGMAVPVYKEEILEKMGDLAIFAPAHATAREQQSERSTSIILHREFMKVQTNLCQNI